MDDRWTAERRRVTGAFDRVADLYRETFSQELDAKPFDRSLLSEVADDLEREGPGGPVLEVGAGSAPVAARLAGGGRAVLLSDASLPQLREARVADPRSPLVAADLARLPVAPGSLAAVVAFYCLIYGPPDHLDAVFADWHRALVADGVVVLAVHAGHGVIPIDEWQGRPLDLAIVLRDPDDVVDRLARNGFAVRLRTVRPPYEHEHQTERLYVVAWAVSR